MDTRALTEEAPRTAADLAADALDVIEGIEQTIDGVTGRFVLPSEAATRRDVANLAFQVQRLARQVAEMAQLVDNGPRATDSEDRADRRQTIRIIEQDDGQPVVIYGNRRAWTIPLACGASNPAYLISDLWSYGPDKMPEHWTEIPVTHES